MFEAIELGQSLPKQEFKSQEPKIRTDLLTLQAKLTEAKVATLIIVAGLEGAGKGEVVDRLNKWFDGRWLETHAFWDESDDERERPSVWRFWKRIPPRGTIGVMFGSWYWDPLYARAREEINDFEFNLAMRRINEMERMLTVDGLLIVKLWFHLSPKMYKKRMKKRREVTKHIKSSAGVPKKKVEYRSFLQAAERIIRRTDSGECQWELIEADDKWFRDSSVAQILLHRMEQGLKTVHIKSKSSSTISESSEIPENDRVTVLDKIDLDTSLTEKDYQEKLDYYQNRIFELSWKAYDSRRSTVIVLEGWDAAGKGGAIRRLTNAIDARLYRVISIAAPTDEEDAQHYLWRFWRHVPRNGYMTLYDRSWYGRVLVERVEGFAKPEEWKRAYQEINDFEEQLANHGTIVIKFWLHISLEEQLARFREREKIAWKRHKITDDDWRNREKWDGYKRAINAMIGHTSTQKIPWTLVPANNKYYARIQVLKTVCKRLEKL